MFVCYGATLGGAQVLFLALGSFLVLPGGSYGLLRIKIGRATCNSTKCAITRAPILYFRKEHEFIK